MTGLVNPVSVYCDCLGYQVWPATFVQSTYNCLIKSVSDIHKHAAAILSDRKDSLSLSLSLSFSLSLSHTHTHPLSLSLSLSLPSLLKKYPSPLLFGSLNLFQIYHYRMSDHAACIRVLQWPPCQAGQCKTGWPRISWPWLGEIASVNGYFYLSVIADTSVRADLALKFTLHVAGTVVVGPESVDHDWVK